MGIFSFGSGSSTGGSSGFGKKTPQVVTEYEKKLAASELRQKLGKYKSEEVVARMSGYGDADHRPGYRTRAGMDAGEVKDFVEHGLGATRTFHATDKDKKIVGDTLNKYVKEEKHKGLFSL